MNNTKKFKIALVEDQQLIRQGLINLLKLEPDFEIVWEAENGHDALKQFSEESEVDIIVSDIRMPLMDGIDFVKKIREQNNNTPVLMLTTFDDHYLFVQALNAGVQGFLLKHASFEKLVKAIKVIANGGFLAEPELLSQQTLIESQGEECDFVISLNEKECQILRYIAAGFTNKEIASAMCLAQGTIKNRISEILEKTQSRDRTQAVLKALRWKLI